MTGKRSQPSPVGSPSSGNISDGSSKDQERFLPIANVSRIMKKTLPANAKISKEAKETVRECVSEFISFVTGEASDKCQREKRKTINGDDLLWAMTTLGFENYVGPLKEYLTKYRETEEDKNSMATSPTNNSNTTSDVTINSISGTGRPDLQRFNGGTHVIPESYHEDGGRIIGYGGENLMGVFNMGKMHEFGDGNGNRAMAAHLHHGVEW